MSFGDSPATPFRASTGEEESVVAGVKNDSRGAIVGALSWRNPSFF
jgi:hypothetical protein